MQINLEDAPEFFNNLKETIVNHIKEDAMLPAANTMLAEYKERIFSDGKDSNGAKIGDYSRTEQYFNKEQFVRKGAFRAQGKTGKKKHDNGVPYKSMYLQEGYYQLRSIQGRDVSGKNYNYSGSLSRAIQVYKTETGVAIGIAEKRESIKLRANENRDGKNVSGATDKELQIFGYELVEAVRVKIEQLL